MCLFLVRKKTYVAVTDSPEPSRNILLARAQEIHETHNNRHSSYKGKRLLLERDSVFSLEDNIIQAMIADASAQNRVIEVNYGYDDSGLGEWSIRNFGNSKTFWEAGQNENFLSSMPECFLSEYKDDEKKDYKNHPLIRAVFGNLDQHESALCLQLWGFKIFEGISK